MDLKLWENKGDQETVRKVVWLISSVSLRNFRGQEGDFNLSVIQQTHGHNSILCSDVSRTHRLAQNLRPFPSLPPLGWVSLKLLQTNESVLKRLSINNLIAQCLGSLILNSHIYQLQSFFFFFLQRPWLSSTSRTIFHDHWTSLLTCLTEMQTGFTQQFLRKVHVSFWKHSLKKMFYQSK